MTAAPDPEAIRREVLNLRRQLTPEEAALRSGAVVRRFISAMSPGHESSTGQSIALYRALPGELDLQVLEDWFLSRGSSLCFPRVKAGGGRQLEYVEVSPVRQRWRWTEGPYGIQEPSAHLAGMSQEDFNLHVNLVFVPGVVFGMNGERVGMGAGYYDRFLATVPAPLRVALAFDFQARAEVRQNPWDQPVDWLITESSEYRGPRVAKWMAGA